MAIYHCSIKVISRGKGKSAVAAAAYRSGEVIHNRYDGVMHDFTRKRGIVYTEVILPPYAPPEFSDRSVLWNSVEQIEKSKNSQLAREIEVALPIELGRDKQIQLVRKYVAETFVSAGMCADFALHDKNDGNPHAHIMLTMRPLQESGEWGAKSKKEYVLDGAGQRIKLKNGNYKTYKMDTTEWNKQENAEIWRKAWADTANQYLEENKIKERIDHRSYKRQKTAQIPAMHMGVAVNQMKKRGIMTECERYNRQIREQNQLLEKIGTRTGRLVSWLKMNTIMPDPDELGIKRDSVPSVLERLDRAKKEVESRQQGNVPEFIFRENMPGKEFLEKNNIATYKQLVKKVQELKMRCQAVHSQIKQTEKKIYDKQKLLEQSEKYMQNREYHKTYMQMEPRKREGYKKKHGNELALYEYAQKYLQEHLGDKKTIRAGEWGEEIKILMSQKDRFDKVLDKLTTEISEAESIRQKAVREINFQRQDNCRMKNRDLER